MQIAFDRRVLDLIKAELRKSPNVEEGGKYVGYVFAASSPQLRHLGLEHERAALVVTDFLPSGPNAIRNAVELQPDGEYQERLFRQLEQMDREVEHLGTWHSHHCNGLQTLSGGDIDGYHRTVNKRAYRLDCFLASLVTRLPRSSSDDGWIDHFLFVRGDREFYAVTNSIQIVDLPSRFGQIIDHRSPAVEGTEDGAERIVQPSGSSRNVPWYEGDEGRRILAEDKRALAARFSGDIVATRRGSAITMTGRFHSASVAVTYPTDADNPQVVVNVDYERQTILHIRTTVPWRQLAFTAAFLAAEALQTDPAGSEAF